MSLVKIVTILNLYFKWNRKYICRTSYSKNKTSYSWNCLQTPRSNKVSRNTAKQFKLALNLYQNGSTLGEENKKIIKGANKVSPERKKYLEFCKTFGLKQWIK